MKFGNKFRHGSLSLAITVLVVVAVLLCNVGVTALLGHNLLFGDLTSESIYTLNPETIDFLNRTFDSVQKARAETGEEAVKVEIIFCADPDILTQNSLMRYVYYTARSLAKNYPKIISVRTVDVWSNPSSVDAYRTNSYSSIYQSNVIVASGSEYRILSASGFYTYSSDTDEEPWAYSGEPVFARTISAVTKAESPICCVTVNHGEPFSFRGKYDPATANEPYKGLLQTVIGAGYRIQSIDLAAEEIPADCRLILVFDPQTDFSSGSILAESAGETGKLDAFLADANSVLVFADADTPYLSNFEEFLEEWGIAFDRYTDPDNELNVLGNYQVHALDSRDSIDGKNLSLIASYETEGTGGSVTSDMRKSGVPAKIIFPNAMPIRYSSTYSKAYKIATESNSSTGAYAYASNSSNGHLREIYDLFRAPGSSYAVAQSGGAPLTDEEENPVTNADGNYKLATLTVESHIVGKRRISNNKITDSSVEVSSYVCAFSSTAFAGDDLLLSNTYGNTDVLLQILRYVGREVVGVGLEIEPLYDAEITQTNSEGKAYYTAAGNTARTVVLALLPALTATGLGIWVLVRRRWAQ